MHFDTVQLNAIMKATQSPLTLITGGAGTGKTTIIKAIAEEFGGFCDILAPTGKAAARLKETGVDACTVHSWLGYTGTMTTRKSAKAPVIIDESSMVDAWLLNEVVKLRPPRIVLVGDSAQLQPVGKGSPFHDALKIRPDLTVELTTCYRNKAAIHKAAYQIRNGQAPDTDDKAEGELWTMRNTGDGKRTTEILLKWIKEGVYDPMQDIVLSCVNGKTTNDYGSVYALNQAIIKELNPRTDNKKFKEGDRVINTKNFNAEDWYNGDTGTIKDIDTMGDLWVTSDRFRADGQVLLVDKDMQKEHSHAYALTVHKSQGSQFRRVFFIVLNRHFAMLSRSLIYTAVTRARQGVVVMGELEAFYSGINRVDKKQTVLQKLSEAELA